MSVHGPDARRRRPWRATWRDGRQRRMRFATEEDARAFDAMPSAARRRVRKFRRAIPAPAAFLYGLDAP